MSELRKWGCLPKLSPLSPFYKLVARSLPKTVRHARRRAKLGDGRSSECQPVATGTVNACPDTGRSDIDTEKITVVHKASLTLEITGMKIHPQFLFLTEWVQEFVDFWRVNILGINKFHGNIDLFSTACPERAAFNVLILDSQSGMHPEQQSPE